MAVEGRPMDLATGGFEFRGLGFGLSSESSGFAGLFGCL